MNEHYQSLALLGKAVKSRAVGSSAPYAARDS